MWPIRRLESPCSIPRQSSGRVRRVRLNVRAAEASSEAAELLVFFKQTAAWNKNDARECRCERGPESFFVGGMARMPFLMMALRYS